MEKTLLSIGHSQHQVDYFINLLKSHDVNYILDVRSTPYSQFAASYNRESIRPALQSNGIEYAFMGNYFGARPTDSSLYSSNGYLDFEKVANSSRFKKGFDNVVKVLNKDLESLLCVQKKIRLNVIGQFLSRMHFIKQDIQLNILCQIIQFRRNKI